MVGLETVAVGMSSRRARMLAAANVFALAGSVALAGWGAVDRELWFTVASAIVAGAAGTALGFIIGRRTMPARERDAKQTAEAVREELMLKTNHDRRRRDRRTTLGDRRRRTVS